MNTKFYLPKSLRNLRPIFKFNGGKGAILCHKCKKIIKEGLTFSDIFRKRLDLLLCPECALEMIMKMFKKYPVEKSEETLVEEESINS